MLITFSGLDGSGKSTQVQFTQAYLQEQGKPVQALHLTRWTWVYRLGERLFKEKVGHSSSLPKTTRPGFRSLRLAMMFVDVVRFWLYLFYWQRRGYVLVCDRYFYDLGVHALYTQVMLPRLARFYWKVIPLPTLAFWLRLEPALAQQREEEHEPHYYESKDSLYEQVVVDRPHIQVVPVTTINETKDFVLSCVRQRMGLVSNS